jgi:hypothetical protein
MMAADTNLVVNSLPVSRSQKLHEFIQITSHGEKPLERLSALHGEQLKRTALNSVACSNGLMALRISHTHSIRFACSTNS